MKYIVPEEIRKSRLGFFRGENPTHREVCLCYRDEYGYWFYEGKAFEIWNNRTTKFDFNLTTLVNEVFPASDEDCMITISVNEFDKLMEQGKQQARLAELERLTNKDHEDIIKEIWGDNSLPIDATIRKCVNVAFEKGKQAGREERENELMHSILHNCVEGCKENATQGIFYCPAHFEEAKDKDKRIASLKTALKEIRKYVSVDSAPNRRCLTPLTESIDDVARKALGDVK